MTKQFVTLALVAMLGTVSFAETMKFSTSPEATAETQINYAAQKFTLHVISQKLDFAKKDNLRQSGPAKCKTDKGFDRPSYFTVCTIPLESDQSQFEAHVRLNSEGTKRGVQEMARSGLQMPTEIKMSYSKFCRVPHLTVTNVQNGVVLLSEVSNDCSMLTSKMD